MKISTNALYLILDVFAFALMFALIMSSGCSSLSREQILRSTATSHYRNCASGSMDSPMHRYWCQEDTQRLCIESGLEKNCWDGWTR